MKKIVLIALALCGLSFAASGQCMNSVAKKVARVSAKQCVLMEKNLTDTTMPKTYQNGKLETSKLRWWCSGFYPGSCWYTYLLTGDENVKQLALRQTEKMMDVSRTFAQHDIGFQTMCSCGLAYKVTGDEKYLPVIRKSAELLAARYSDVTKLIRSWDSPKYACPTIIDNMMNLELLTYAAKKFNKPQWREIAIQHAKTTIKNHFRPDNSSYHLVDYNPKTGEVIRKITVQGYADESAWSRGQSWGLYGYTMMYRETSEPAFLEQAEKIAAYLLEKLEKEAVPTWDFNAPENIRSIKDASAGAVISSALVELATLTKDPAKARAYREQAKRTMKTLALPYYLAEPGENGNFLLKHSTGYFLANSEVDVPLTYADYYYLEALYRFKNLK